MNASKLKYAVLYLGGRGFRPTHKSFPTLKAARQFEERMARSGRRPMTMFVPAKWR